MSRATVISAEHAGRIAAAERRQFWKGMAFLSPWLFGFTVFLILPIALSLVYSVCDYSLLQGPVYRGAENYIRIWEDEIFWKVLRNTVHYAALAIPASFLVSLGFALLLNVTIPGQAIFRTIIFLPSLAPAVASAMVWLFLLNSKLGLVNTLLGFAGIGVLFLLGLALLCTLAIGVVTFRARRRVSPLLIASLVILAAPLVLEAALRLAGTAGVIANWSISGPGWLTEPRWVLNSFVLMSLWGVGHTVVIYLAGLQDVPRELYEAAEIDGASTLRRLWHVTLPTLSPVIFFNLIMAIIGTLQIFTGPQLITNGGPDNASRFYSMYLYDYAFEYLKMGQASAMAWIQLILILALTGLAFWTSRKWVHYQGK